MPAARAASSREAPSSTSARASIRRAARASRHRAASRRSSTAPGSFRVIATVMAPSADRPHRRSTASGATRLRARRRVSNSARWYNLFQNMHVMGNVTIAPVKVKRRDRREVEAEAARLLARVGLADKHHAYPDELSGGQQQRVAIARALALNPEILLLDEVTSALDPELVGEVLETIHRLAADGMTMLIVSHEMAFVREISGKVVMMDRGRVVEEGPPARIFDAPETERARDFVGKILRH